MPLRSPARVTAVRRTPELERIMNLPRRSWREHAEAFVEPLTQHLKTPRGELKLHPWQAAVMAEAYEVGGVFCQAEVGAGKTLVSLTYPVLVEAQRPVLLVPASTRDKTLENDIPFYRKNFRMHPRL